MNDIINKYFILVFICSLVMIFASSSIRQQRSELNRKIKEAEREIQKKERESLALLAKDERRLERIAKELEIREDVINRKERDIKYYTR